MCVLEENDDPEGKPSHYTAITPPWQWCFIDVSKYNKIEKFDSYVIMLLMSFKPMMQADFLFLLN